MPEVVEGDYEVPFRQNDTQIYSFIVISCVENNLKVFFLVHNQELVHRVLITLIL